jgi:ABC-type sugar transport system ATPase subunit
VSEAINLGIAYCPEDRRAQGLCFNRSLGFNLTLVILRLLGRRGVIDRAREREIAAGLAKRFQIKASGLKQRVSTLSGGTQQKVLLARWLGTNPKVLLLDEPTRGIDVATRSDIYRLIGEFAARGIAVIVTSSENEELIKLCDRILVMRNGRISGEVSAADATDDRLLKLSVAQAGAAP